MFILRGNKYQYGTRTIRKQSDNTPQPAFEDVPKYKAVISVEGTNIVINELDRSLFAHQFTYEYCLKNKISNNDWVAIKKMFKERKHEVVHLSVKK